MEKHIEQKKKSAMISLLFGGIVEVMFILKTFLKIGRGDFPWGSRPAWNVFTVRPEGNCQL